MKRNILICLFALLTCATFAAGTNSTAEQTEVNYTKAIEGRTAAILKILDLSDTNKITRVHDTIIAQYRALNAWHDANDAKLKAAKSDTNAVAQIHVSLQAIHDQFLAKLAENLTPEQVDAVKDKMTYGKVQFTFKGYIVEYTNLPEAQQQHVLELLKEARELAMDGGSSEEKTAIFNKYKGKINNYLSKAGFEPASKKSKAAKAAQQ
jgi:Spy/CpxP family protein refolding chaperone